MSAQLDSLHSARVAFTLQKLSDHLEANSFMEVLKRCLVHEDFPSESINFVQLVPNQKILTEGQNNQDLYLVIGGLLRVSGEVQTEAGHRVKVGLWDLEPGQVFGETSSILGDLCAVTVTSVNATELLHLQGAKFFEFLDKHASLAYPVLRLLLIQNLERQRVSTKRALDLFSWGLRGHGLSLKL